MAALEAVREELETALGDDENWRALHHTGGSRGDADADRRDRDARLVKALQANPLYLAWTNVCEAIDALRDADGAPEAALTAIELPENIRARIRADADGDAAIGEDAREKSGTLGRKLATIPSLDPVQGSGKMVAEPLVAAGSEQPEPLRTAISESAAVRAGPRGDLPPLRMTEPAEAKVTFVRRQTPAAAAKAPAGTAAQTAAGGNAFVPAAGAAEEAEVAIVNAPVRRFLKALSGD